MFPVTQGASHTRFPVSYTHLLGHHGRSAEKLHIGVQNQFHDPEHGPLYRVVPPLTWYGLDNTHGKAYDTAHQGTYPVSYTHLDVYKRQLLGMDTPDIVSKGITLVPEGRRVFPDMTVIENIKIGAYLRTDSLDQDIEWVYSLFPRLKERSWQLAGTLSGGEQQMLAVRCV